MPFDLIYSVSVKLQATRYFANLIYSNQIISYACMFCENINDMPRGAITSPTSAGWFPGKRHYPPTLAAASPITHHQRWKSKTFTQQRHPFTLLSPVSSMEMQVNFFPWLAAEVSQIGQSIDTQG